MLVFSVIYVTVTVYVLYVCVYVCMCVCVCACMNACVCACACMFVCMSGLRDVVDPLVQARVLEDPAMHLVEELQVGDNRGYLGSRPEEPREGMVARHRQLTEEDSTVARALGSASVEARGKVGPQPPVEACTQNSPCSSISHPPSNTRTHPCSPSTHPIVVMKVAVNISLLLCVVLGYIECGCHV